jgi:hypothetical protein
LIRERYRAGLTSLLNVFTGTPNALANPKSPILSSPRLLINKFCGLKMGQNHLACAVRDKNVDLGLLKEA